jgi:phosphatidylinositol alpha-1,6-mannosyltransferase
VKIVHAAITYPPAVGGLDRYVKETAEGLVHRGHKVVVVTTDLEQPLSRRRLRISDHYADGAEVHRLRAVCIPRTGFPFAPATPHILQRSGADVFHAHCVFHSSAYFAWKASRRKRVPLVLNTIFSPRSGWFWNWYRSTANRIMSDAACVFAISDFERNLLVQAGLPSARVVVLAPGVDLEPLRRPQVSIFPRYGIQTKRVIVSLARIAFGKRIDRLIAAMPAILRKHPEAHLLIIGPDYGDEARLRELVNSFSLQEAITFAGPLSADDVTAALQWCTVFAMTSDFELFGITLIEAMAAGAPVVAPNIASVPFVVRNNETGLLYSHNSSEELAAKLIVIMTDEDLRLRMIAEGRNEAEHRFDFGRNLDRLVETYERVCRN